MHALLLTRYLKSEADFDEWITHHLSVGFSHVHVFDNGTVFDLEAASGKYGGAVSYERVIGPTCQYSLYSDYIARCDAEYVMPIDDDEYLSLGPFGSVGELMDKFGRPDCFAFRWKYLFPADFSVERTGPVLEYCTESNPRAARFFCGCGDNLVKCIVKTCEFVRYMDSRESMARNHIPVTKSDSGAMLYDGTRTRSQAVRADGDEPVRLLHCPFKGMSEFLSTRGAPRPSVSRLEPCTRKGRDVFIQWLSEQGSTAGTFKTERGFTWP